MLIKLLAFVAYFSLQLSVRVEAVVVCPPADVISPCTCRRYSTRTNSTYLNCGSSRNLADSQVNDILDAYLATPNVSPVGRLQLSNNALLTRIPVQVKYFTQLEYADIYFNSIASIESGAFNNADDSNPLWDLRLEFNQLVTIAPGAFKGFQLFHFHLFLYPFSILNDSHCCH